MKRIIVFCDGTGQDGLAESGSTYTNVLRLARSVVNQDERKNPPIPQIVLYQPGVGSEKNLYSDVIDAATGATIGGKIEQGYGFIAQNYQAGDEVFLFGFSRGAYTARMIATLIGEIGILDRKSMDNFAEIFRTYTKLGGSEDASKILELKSKVSHWTDPKSIGRQRADPDGDGFTIKCIGVFDTVDSVGLPEELTWSDDVHPLFGVSDRVLGKYVERAYHALALDEKRDDFELVKFEQTVEGRQKGQVLKQCWFSGCHTDIGGGYIEHDLADITLMWMAAHVNDILSLDFDYLSSLRQPVAPWGQQIPHNSRTGVFAISLTSPRHPPSTDPSAEESVHPSVLEQGRISLDHLLLTNPGLVCPLTQLEEEWKQSWPYDPDAQQVQRYTNARARQENDVSTNSNSFIFGLLGAIGITRPTTTRQTTVIATVKSGHGRFNTHG